ncbi:ricin-type beta-trefoil lectin domain protein [Streptomyces sp. NPDC046759]|uniref:ricin-type beta-trefoil lectin domain protein n=1 Tax=Streptomyces sp. NPDC046759 TaxID=3155019 RepID=UPI003401510A
MNEAGRSDEQLSAELKKWTGGTPALHPVGELLDRHWAAAFAYARLCTDGTRAAGMLTTAAFTRLFGESLRQAGPTAAWRPHVLVAVRRIAAEWDTDGRHELLHPALRSGATGERAAARLLPPPGRRQLSRAFQRVPQSSRALLWHTEVEAEPLAVPASLLGLDEEDARVELHRAGERLREECLQVHRELAPENECRRYQRMLDVTFRRGGVDIDPDLRQHLGGCGHCSRTADQLAAFNGGLGLALAEAVLGWGAGEYLQSRAARTGQQTEPDAGAAAFAPPFGESFSAAEPVPRSGSAEPAGGSGAGGSAVRSGAAETVRPGGSVGCAESAGSPRRRASRESARRDRAESARGVGTGEPPRGSGPAETTGPTASAGSGRSGGTAGRAGSARRGGSAPNTASAAAVPPGHADGAPAPRSAQRAARARARRRHLALAAVTVSGLVVLPLVLWAVLGSGDGPAPAGGDTSSPAPGKDGARPGASWAGANPAAQGALHGRLRSLASGLCIGVVGKKAVEGAETELTACSATPSQQWTYETDGLLRNSAAPGLCLDSHLGYSVRLAPCSATGKAGRNIRYDFTLQGALIPRWNQELALTPAATDGSGALVLKTRATGAAQRWAVDTAHPDLQMQNVDWAGDGTPTPAATSRRTAPAPTPTPSDSRTAASPTATPTATGSSTVPAPTATADPCSYYYCGGGGGGYGGYGDGGAYGGYGHHRR